MTAPDPTPISACSLDRDGQARRVDELRALLPPSLRALRRTGAAAQLDLALGPSGERALAALLELEAECCPFWRFRLARLEPGLVRLDVAAAEPHEAAVDAFLTLARPSPAGRLGVRQAAPAAAGRPATRAESQ